MPILLPLLFVACGPQAVHMPSAKDTGSTEPAVDDTSSSDTGPSDTGPSDTGPSDTSARDTTTTDTGPCEPSTWHADDDGDGYGDPATEILACEAPPGDVADATDCDDTQATIHPYAFDACGDAVDSDCDGADPTCGVAWAAASADLILPGRTGGAGMGTAVDGGGDLTGDGVNDLLLGAYLDRTGGRFAGAAWVVPGPLLGGTRPDHFEFLGVEHDYAGEGARMVGDLDGDGYSDALVGGPAATTPFVAVLAGPLAAGANLADLPQITGQRRGDGFGAFDRIAGAGDVDGDGLADVGLGLPGSEPFSCSADGTAYVLRGPLTAGDVASEAWATFPGATTGDCHGAALSVHGDLDGDGVDDIVVSAPDDAGAVYVYTQVLGGSHPVGEADVTLFGSGAADLAGSAVEAAGDVDGDGHADLLVGSAGASTDGVETGAAYLLRGPISEASSLAAADATVSGASPHGAFGWSASNDGGDVDGDGRADILVGALFATNDSGAASGAAYLWYGPMSGHVDANAADVVLQGTAANDYFGITVSTAGDVNGDGFDEILVGATMADSDLPTTGAAYLWFGGARATR